MEKGGVIRYGKSAVHIYTCFPVQQTHLSTGNLMTPQNTDNKIQVGGLIFFLKATQSLPRL